MVPPPERLQEGARLAFTQEARPVQTPAEKGSHNVMMAQRADRINLWSVDVCAQQSAADE